MRHIFVTGGAGFIGANFVHHALSTGARLINLDALTYVGNLDNLQSITQGPNYRFINGGIGDAALVSKVLQDDRPDWIRQSSPQGLAWT